MADKKTSDEAPAPVSKKGGPDGAKPGAAKTQKEEFGGRGGADPTRFGDWEKDGRCVDF